MSCEGHSGYSERGSDIVCAAISTLIQALCLGLQEVVRPEQLSVVKDPDIPRISVGWIDNEYNSCTLYETIYLSCAAIEDQYSEYVTVDRLSL